MDRAHSGGAGDRASERLAGDDLYTRLGWFFERLHQNAFDQGRREARAALQAEQPDLPGMLEAIQRAPAAAPPAGVSSPAACVLCFGYLYFTARDVIESSYRYRHALCLIGRATACLDTLAAIDAGLASMLREFSALQSAVCDIDRGVYNNMPTTMRRAAVQLTAEVDALMQRRETLEQRAAGLFDRFVRPVLDGYRVYARAMVDVAQLYGGRWEAGPALGRAIERQAPSIERAVREIETLGDKIMASDLAAHLPVLRAFAASPRRGGELRIEDGRLCIGYFAPLAHGLQDDVARLVETGRAEANGTGLALAGLNASRVAIETLSDIWSGLAARAFVTTYRWELPPLDLAFRDRELVFDVMLQYHSMGVFALHLSAPLRQVSASGLRHAMSLGLPYALDEAFTWGASRQPFAFLSEFAEHVFSRLREELEQCTGRSEGGSRALHWDAAENRFVCAQLDSIARYDGGLWRRIDAEQLQQHLAYPALALPLREVRSAIDDWILRPPAVAADNIAPLRYNAGELMTVARHGAVVALLEQPDWVREQAVESVVVAAAITQLLQVTSTVLGNRIRHRQWPGIDRGRRSRRQLRAQRKAMQAEWARLDRFEGDLRWLLDLIRAGSIMRYPDHTRLMRAVFAAMEFEQLSQHTHEIMAEVKQRHRRVLDEAAFIVDAARNRTSRRMNAILSGLMALLSIGAVKDIFYLFNAADLGYTISARVQIAVVLGLLAVMAVLLLFRGGRSED